MNTCHIGHSIKPLFLCMIIISQRVAADDLHMIVSCCSLTNDNHASQYVAINTRFRYPDDLSVYDLKFDLKSIIGITTHVSHFVLIVELNCTRNICYECFITTSKVHV